MNREQLIQRLRRLAKDQNVEFDLDKHAGKGSHYRVRYNGRISTLQQHLNPGRIRRILKQLEIDPANL